MKAIDPKAFGKRVRERRVDLGMSQGALGELSGYSQSNIGWLESGAAKRPQRAASDLADHLQTTRDWLLWGQGPKHVGPVYLSTKELAEKYEALSPEKKAKISQAIEENEQSVRQKKRA